jgi:maltose alpha-D-glucosyltransferase/alpha-amylase
MMTEEKDEGVVLIDRTQGDWYKDAIIYQLHIKAFMDANNDGIGDFAGLIDRLDYVAELGVTAIWLLPFYVSPLRDDGYDIADYREINPNYGRQEDFQRLVDEAHARGLRVITELVINHTSDQHPWFQRARLAPAGSPERDFYVWSDSDAKFPETRIIFIDTEKSNWTFDAEAGAFYWHRFYSHQPDLNFDNPEVLKEVLSVMRYWLDMGVDGLRLDAIPYLVEREGTNNENLLETHDVLKKIRAELDAHYQDRMLLAEANQWPEDTRPYFGEGDECHMGFHFPLMPRMFMAVAQEDRHPITDIIRQTPEIPPNCQWAIFLRNHDELTLEMVTDEERDYMWTYYATDRRSRINLGIRRRLAPLLGNDRRKIELLNGMLFSMPGTPVVYYGDEIGMGDNYYLGDRDGVRTPMQWSADRNGGFSRASPQQLFLPIIQDPIYGYQAINVEAQQSSLGSLLSWMKRIIRIRKRQKVFGRGDLTFLYPGNRKVLAYVRSDGEDAVLCVFNVSRSAQAVELDLSAHRGCVPVELEGGSSFPPIGDLPYMLTLPPYGFYWFLLATEAALPNWHAPAPEPMSELSTLVLRKSLAEILEPAARKIIETDILPPYLTRRRWFAGKAAAVRARLGFAEPIAGADGREVLLAEVEANDAAGTGSYLLPMGIAWEDETTAALPQQLALARVRRGRRVGVLTDAFALDVLPGSVLRGMRDRSVIPLRQGEIHFLPTSIFDAVEFPEDPEIRRLSAEQSNSSLIIGEHAVLKLVRRVTEGISPETEMTRYLTERGFGQTAPLLGEVVRISPDGIPRTLVVLQGFVRNQGDGWTWTTEFLSRMLDAEALADPPRQAGDGVFDNYLTFASALGRRLAEMHSMLAEESDDPAFRPELATSADAQAWGEAAAAQIALALTALEGVANWETEAQQRLADGLIARRDALLAAAVRLGTSAERTLKTRVHGDFHLGQALVVQGDACIIDFEGEPAKPLQQRRAKSSPLRDVAGLLRSFDYAAAGVRAERESGQGAPNERIAELLMNFRESASEAFVAAYRGAHALAPRPWIVPEGEQALLDLFLLEKAAYEICYEAANRPGWLHIPLRGFDELAARVLGPETAHD